jgi:SAM-dependent methyltransferase
MPSQSYASDDTRFDAIYPARIRRISRRFWTPVAVARAAAALFVEAGAHHVLDVGSGVGKFVLATALAAPKLQLVGVEQRPHLVAIADRARDELGTGNARFAVGDATAIPWDGFDGLYLFNILAENLFHLGDRIDDEVELSAQRFKREKVRIERALRRMPLGTALVTYHGSSTRIPACYELRGLEQAGTDWVRLWVKSSESDDGSHFQEADGGTVRHLAAVREGAS